MTSSSEHLTTIRDVAREAGVAISTVSYALNGKNTIGSDTRKRVLDAAEKLGYKPRPSRKSKLKDKNLPLLGLLFPGGPGEPPRDYHYLPETVRGATEAAQDFGFLITILYQRVKNPLLDFPLLCKSGKVKGILVSGPRVHDDILSGLMSEGFPTVLLHGHPSTQGMPTVGIDNESGAFRATEHLIILGHTRIAMLLPGALELSFSADRFEGYKRALSAYSIPFDPELVRNGELFENIAEEEMTSLLDLPSPPTAVFAGNDTQGIGAIRAARKHGLEVPSDIAIIGFDDTTAARQCNPPLTTMHVPDYKMAAEATRMLIRKILRPEIVPETILVPVDLVIRDSCGARTE